MTKVSASACVCELQVVRAQSLTFNHVNPGQEMTSVRSKYMEYDSLDKQSALYEKRIRSEAARYYQRRLIPRPPPGRKFGRPCK